MKVERFNFRELAEGMAFEAVAGAKVFMPSHSSREAVPPPPPPPIFNEADLKAAERDGYKKGFLEGEKEGRKQAEHEQAEVNRRIADVSEKFVRTLVPLFMDYRDRMVQLQENMPKVALAIARKVAGNALEQNAHVIISEIAARCCETMIHEPKLTMTVHESMGNTLEQTLQHLAGRLPAATDIIIQRDPDMPLTDCRIEWQQGCLEHSNEVLWQQLEKVVADMMITAAQNSQKQMDTLKTQLPPADETPTTQKE